ncbi:hypothetical protein D6C89_07286 [Aureobasidium pullulans]|nr:hypothetical protein D6C89_07286 [Aureobasidium pullulans]
MNPITDTRIRDCDICLTSHPSMELLQWNCGSCFWCFDCISSGITSAPLKSDWPQIWCGHSIPLPIPLLVILLRSRHHIDDAIYQEWDGKLREWEMIICPYCFRMTYPKFVEGKVVVCKGCGLRICVECEKSAHPGPCIRTSKEEEPQEVLKPQKQEAAAAATCPSCKLVAVRTEEKCQRITCPNPCGQNYCSQCSRDWKECNGLCKITTAEVLDKAAGNSSPNVIETLLLNLKRDVELEIRLLEQHKKAKKKVAVLKEDCDSFLSIIKQALEDDAITHARSAEIKESVEKFLEPLKMARGVEVFEEEEEVVYSENWRKRGPSPDPLFAAIKKTKTVAVVEEEEAEDAEENLDDLELEESMIAALTEGQDEDDHIHNDEEEDIKILIGGDEYGEGDEDEDEDEEYGNDWDDDQIEEDWPNY